LWILKVEHVNSKYDFFGVLIVILKSAPVHLVFIEDCRLGRPVKVVNVCLVPQHVFHDILFLHSFTAIHLGVLDDCKSLNINYLFTLIDTFKKFKGNRVQNIIANMSFNGGIGVHFFFRDVWWTPIPIVS